ncbi:tetratricopeptide repeat protein [Lysobacter soli]|uniref:tetratricopeptide repeat protein n=1 Tax=Lysobacter TaxID=68 RepID=UPI0012ECBDF9|nr:tetratricopeptide repeat protein [Lysobacter soli]QGW63450.1 tetratricopeptide repeat protein [Lysobacter soli]UTA54785.1 tetratricopeptide repeat protein [Lysobacter soli]
MNKFSLRNRSILAAAIGAVLVFGAVSQVNAQSAQDRAEERRARQAEGKQKAAKPAEEYPQATRQVEAKASSKGGQKLQKMMGLYDDDKGTEARAAADEIIATETFNAYDRAFAAQMAAQIAYDADDTAAAKNYLRKAIELNGLDNNGHYGAMYMLAQLQLQDEQYAESLKTLDTFFNETKSTKPEQLVVKGNALYRLERYPEAATVLKQAIDSSPTPKPEWQQLLMATYAESGNAGEAAKMAEAVAAKNPNDKRAQLNLAAVYQQGEMYDKSAAVLEKLRASGQLTEDKEYRQLYATYLNMDGKEKEAIAVINDGIQKGVLKPDYQTYLAQAQAYYFSDQAGPAIDAYKKAAPLAPDGEAYLNLARVLWQEDRIPEAKEAAKQAVAKGVKKPDDAKKILALPGK